VAGVKTLLIAFSYTRSPCAVCFAEGRLRLLMARAMAEATLACQTGGLCAPLRYRASDSHVAARHAITRSTVGPLPEGLCVWHHSSTGNFSLRSNASA
jgi:hypothetical protein